MGKKNRQRRAQKKRDRAKRKKELKKTKLMKGNQPVGPVFQKMQNPFADLNEGEREQVAKEIAQKSEQMYQESLAKIKEILFRYDPINLLSIMALHGLMIGVGDDGIKTKDSDLKIQQSNIELCQGLALQINNHP